MANTAKVQEEEEEEIVIPSPWEEEARKKRKRERNKRKRAIRVYINQPENFPFYVTFNHHLKWRWNKVINKSQRELCHYTANPWIGCQHGCRYPCYAFERRLSWNQINTYLQWIIPRAVLNFEERLQIELPKLADKKIPQEEKVVTLCTMTDLFMPISVEKKIPDLYLPIFHHFNVPYRVLTKNKLVALPEYIRLFSESETTSVGLTINLDDENLVRIWERYSSSIEERVTALRALKDAGISNFVNIEPCLDTTYPRKIIEPLLDIVDFWIIGAWNVGFNTREFNAREAMRIVTETTEVIEDYGIKAHIKRSLISRRKTYLREFCDSP